MSGLLVDGLPVQAVAAARAALLLGTPSQQATSRQTDERYWSTPRRPLGDPTRDVLEVALSDQRLVNYVSLELPSFPHQAALQYQDLDTGAWRPVLRADSGQPVAYAVREPVPAVVDQPSGDEHPQHRGPGHWLPVSFRTRPFLARVVRLLLSRDVAGTQPRDPLGQPAAYSLGARSLQLGYRVTGLGDVPRYGDVATYKDDFATSTDLLGSRVTFRLAQDSPSAVLTGAEGDLWRSEPMPVPYAVVSFYADTRDATGEGQVVDRWYMEPLTTGPAVNLYYSNGEPSGSVPASDQALSYPIVQLHGTSATPQHYPPTLTPEHISFSHVYPSYVDVDNAFVQFDPSRPWWLGVEVASPYYGPDGVSEVPEAGDSHPIWSFGGSVLRTVPGSVEFTSQGGPVLTVPLDPAHARGSRWRAVVSYDGAVLDLTYQLGAGQPATSSAVAPPPPRPAVIRLGGYPDADDPGVPGIVMRALVVKAAAPDPEDVARFLADPQGYVTRPPYAVDDDGSTDDSILRLEPARASADLSPAGLFGGPGDPYESLVWTPVLRDYAMRRGYLYLPPTRAKYWKFEITNLAAEPYESFLPIRHDVRTFTSQVSSTGQPAPGGAPRAGAGTLRMTDLGPAVPYYGATVLQQAEARSALARRQHSATEALVARTPGEAQRVAEYGWVWGFQGLHVGASAPRFTTVTRHVYETVTIDRRSKVAYFAGLRRLRPYRVDYLADDDPEQYLDHLDDLRWATDLDGMSLVDGALLSESGVASATWATMPSTTPVRAVQFATQQTDPAQVLPDDDFTGDFAAAGWEAYGDADLVPEYGRVVVNRGWRPETWGDVEDERGPAYQDLEALSYADLEGSEPAGGSGGGVQSGLVATSTGGQVYAAARVSAADAATAPLVLQVVSESGEVLAQASAPALAAGEDTTIVVAYGVGTALDRLPYAAIEDAGTWGDAEGLTYGQHEATQVLGRVRARLAQLAPSSDVFAVTRLSLFDDPITWEFSVDAGATWYAARGVRNNRSGVLTFPAPGRQLRWRVRASLPGVSVSAVAVRPWYVGHGRAVPGRPGSAAAGPNLSPADHYPPLERDPMWMGWDRAVPRSWYTAVAATAPAQPAAPPPPVGTDRYEANYPAVYGGPVGDGEDGA